MVAFPRHSALLDPPQLIQIARVESRNKQTILRMFNHADDLYDEVSACSLRTEVKEEKRLLRTSHYCSCF